MTIGIAACGPRAGAAVHAALLGAELLGRGAIGGFAVYAVLDQDGVPRHRQTQRGGVGQLDVPAAWLDARVAAAISSGPDRPEPLVQFLPGATGVGLVTGHRLPNRAGRDGVPLNQAVLARLAQGSTPSEAVDAVMAANPEVDAGLIAVTPGAGLAWGESARVARRTDRGAAQRDDAPGRLALLHNSIQADVPGGLAQAVAELAWAQMRGQPAAWSFLTLAAPVPVLPAARDRVLLDEQGAIAALETADPHLPALGRRGTAVYLGTEVWQGARRLGHAVSELYADLTEGTARPIAGLASQTIVMRADDVAA